MKRPLSGKKIVITRDGPQAANFAKKISVLGGISIIFPAIRILAPIHWRQCDRALKDLNQFDWIVFSSANSVRFFMQRARQKGIEVVPSRIAAIGNKTASEVNKYRHQADIIPTCFNASGLLSVFNNTHMANKRILLPCSNIARKELTMGLRKIGADVSEVCFYRTVPNTEIEIDPLMRYINKNEIDIITFFSPSAVTHFFSIVGKELISVLKSNAIKMAAIGPTTAKGINRNGLSAAIVPDTYNEDCLLDSLQSHINQKTQFHGDDDV